MDLPLSKKDIILAFSEYASMITIVKLLIKKLEHDAQHHTDRYLEKMKDAELKRTQIALDKHVKLWIHDLKNMLYEFEFYGRAITLRTFFHPSNHLYALRSPMCKMENQHCSIPVYNITFPEYERNELSPMLHKLKTKLKKRCTGRNLAKMSICEMKTIE